MLSRQVHYIFFLFSDAGTSKHNLLMGPSSIFVSVFRSTDGTNTLASGQVSWILAVNQDPRGALESAIITTSLSTKFLLTRSDWIFVLPIMSRTNPRYIVFFSICVLYIDLPV